MCQFSLEYRIDMHVFTFMLHSIQTFKAAPVLKTVYRVGADPVTTAEVESTKCDQYTKIRFLLGS